MKQLQRAFVEHPQSVGESYWQHMRASLSFAVPLLLGALAALVHAVFPFLLVRTGSGIVTRLHERMVRNRAGVKALP
ncbi:MAG: DUF6356 family protein [Pseudomonadota bacterium]